jgi:hypothetical protein
MTGTVTDSVTPDLPPELRKPRLRRWEASDYLLRAHGVKVAAATLAKLATVGGGPPYHKCGRAPLYPVTELDRWACERLGALVRSSSDPANHSGGAT